MAMSCRDKKNKFYRLNQKPDVSSSKSYLLVPSLHNFILSCPVSQAAMFLLDFGGAVPNSFSFFSSFPRFLVTAQIS